MADHPFTGSLHVTGNVSIGHEPSGFGRARLYIRPPMDAPPTDSDTSQISILNLAGDSCKLGFEGDQVRIGTVRGITQSLNLITDDQPRLSIARNGAISISETLLVQRTLSVTGNVGIGTPAGIDTPAIPAQLNVTGTVIATAFQGSGADLSGVVRLAGANTMTGPLTIQNVLTATGNVIIGTPAASDARLNVDGTVRATAFQGNGENLSGVARLAGANTMTGLLTIQNALSVTGNVSIGTPAASSTRLNVNGSARVTGNLEVNGNIVGHITGIGFASAVLQNGQSIPIPTGFSHSECIFLAFVKFTKFNSNEAVNINCYADRNGKVVATPINKVWATGIAIAKRGGW